MPGPRVTGVRNDLGMEKTRLTAGQMTSLLELMQEDYQHAMELSRRDLWAEAADAIARASAAVKLVCDELRERGL